MCMVDDGDEGYYPFQQKMQTARKEYRCYECRRVIPVGESYLYSTGLAASEKRWDSYHTCAHCKWAADWLVEQCGGYLFGGVLEDLEEHWREEPLLCTLSLGRRIVLMRRRWLDKSGALIAVPV